MRRSVTLVLALVMALAVPLKANAQPIASGRPINLFVGFAAGGPADLLARIVAERLQEQLGQPVVVQNRGGAGGTIAAATLAKTKPDGTNLMLVTSGHSGAPALYRALPFDNQKDFAPIVALAQSPVVVLVDAKSPYRDIRALVAAAKASPGKLNFGTGGGGATLTALAAVQLCRDVAIDAVAVNYPGSGPANLALMSGTIDFGFDIVSGAMGLLSAGSVRGLAVTSPKRSSVLPDVPTVAETVKPGFDITGWFGILAPAGMEPELVARLNGELNRLLSVRETRQRLAALGLDPIGGTPQQFGDLIASETIRWGGLIRDLGLKAD
ncbi:MAG: tripartite tricarboxylate transporter substrate-binding protein [Reyranellaceae bacterium]